MSNLEKAELPGIWRARVGALPLAVLQGAWPPGEKRGLPADFVIVDEPLCVCGRPLGHGPIEGG